MEDIGNKGRERVEMEVDKKIRRRIRRRRKKNPARRRESYIGYDDGVGTRERGWW
jgi:hypothetical protein